MVSAEGVIKLKSDLLEGFWLWKIFSDKNKKKGIIRNRLPLSCPRTLPCVHVWMSLAILILQPEGSWPQGTFQSRRLKTCWSILISQSHGLSFKLPLIKYQEKRKKCFPWFLHYFEFCFLLLAEESWFSSHTFIHVCFSWFNEDQELWGSILLLLMFSFFFFFLNQILIYITLYFIIHLKGLWGIISCQIYFFCPTISFKK